MTLSVCEIMRLHQLLMEVDIETPVLAKLWFDNQIALHIDYNLVFYERIKHIEIDCQFFREKIQFGLISTGYEKIGEQLDDIFAKALSEDRVNYLCNRLDMINIYAPVGGGVL